MMRKFLLICLLGFSFQAIRAQSNTNEAKAAYLLAEESYGKGDYKGTLEFLHQVRETLGSPNCKVLYLQIMATRELYAKDTSGNNKVLPLILEFEKSPDYADFNEEKTVEITKLKLLVKKEIKAVQEKADAENTLKAAREKYLFGLLNKWGKFEVTLDDVDKAHPDWNVKTWKIFDWNKRVQVYHPPSLEYTKSSYPFTKMRDNDSSLAGKVSGIVFIDGILSGYYSYEVDYDESSKMNQGISFSSASDDKNRSSATVTEKSGIVPTSDTFITDGHSGVRYTWQYGNYMIMDYPLFYFKRKPNTVVRLVRYVQYVAAGRNK